MSPDAPDPIDVAVRVAQALDGCGVPYAVGGSVASSISGEPRSTLDVDIVVALDEPQVEAVVAALGDDFYIDADALRRAIRQRSHTNLIHYATSVKVDLFIQGGTTDRRAGHETTAAGEPRRTRRPPHLRSCA